MFAGGGTNSAVSHYSAYTISKIASIKMIELLDYEIADCKFSIIGPGWVESKIHNATIKAGSRAGTNYDKTLHMRGSKLMSPVQFVIEACNWVIEKPKEISSGRNFSAVFDDFSSNELETVLSENVDFFKLRRYGNGKYER
jgi:NAD(P)-dependent dehydrogenase (short-subunit alcohol dehydrogenase family)